MAGIRLRAPVLWTKGVALVTAGMFLFAGPCFGALVNGDFEAGNSGFTSDYPFTTSDSNDSQYTVGTDPLLYNPFASTFGDHTTGTGKMMIVDGFTTSNKVVWQQIVPVTSATPYVFSAWAASWGKLPTVNVDPSPASLTFVINGTAILSNQLLPGTDGQWTLLSGSWNSASASTATIQIFDLTTAHQGNDFALDDLSFSALAVPEPATAALVGLGAVALVRRRRAS